MFFLSAGLSVLTSLTLIVIGQFLYLRNWLPLSGFFRYLERSFGIFPVAVVAGLILFVLFVILLSYRNIRYMVEIQRAVQRIASGELDHRIAVRSRDEMGQLAAHINHMAQQLKDSIEQERSAV